MEPYKKNAAILALLALAIPFSAMGLPEPTVEWTVDIGSDYAATPLPYPSGAPDSLVFATGGYAARISGTGELLFKTELGPEGGRTSMFSPAGRGSMFSPALGDVDGDGKEEIIAGRKDGTIYALDADTGKIYWECQVPDRLMDFQGLEAADLDGDGRAEVVVSTLHGWVYCIAGDGQILWRSKVEDYRPSAPSIADIDSDGEPEIVYGTATRYLVALDATGKLEWTSFHPPHHLGQTVPLVADADGDGRAEVYGMSSMLSPGQGLVSLNGADGALRWYGLTIGKAYRGRALTRFADGSTGILSCDKGGNIHAQNADGTLRWHTRVSGAGVYHPPVTADLDGDGALELVTMVRGTSTDGKNNNWYVLNAATGETLGAWNHGGQGYMGAAVLDADRDGTLEVILCSAGGTVSAYTFGGRADDDAIVFGHAQQRTFPLRVAKSIDSDPTPARPVSLIEKDVNPRFGTNDLEMVVLDGAAATAVEVTTRGPDGLQSSQLFRAEGGRVAANWQAMSPGKYGISLRLLDEDSGETLGVQELEATLQGEGALGETAGAAISSIRELSQSTSSARLTLELRASEMEIRLASLRDVISDSAGAPLTEQAAIAKDADEFAAYIARSERFAGIVASEAHGGQDPKFVCWADENPWDNRNPHDTVPVQGGQPSTNVWALGNEKESVCFNVLNVSAGPVTLRVEPGSVDGSETPISVEEVASLHRVVWLPTSDGIPIADMLPRLDEGYLMDLAPGEIRQLWINLSTRELAAGSYTFTWPIRSLDRDADTVDLSVRLDVSPVRLPEESRFYTGYWSQNSLDGFSTVPDLNDHLQNFWDRVPHWPAATADAEGNLTGELDWSEWDAFLNEVQQHGVIRLHGIAMPTFEAGAEPTDEIKLKAQRNFIKAWITHMEPFGLGYRDFAFYVEDETGLRGTHENFMARAREVKAIDPNLQVYANPWGAITKDMLREMAPLTGIWQPGMEVIEYHGREVVDIMRADGGRRIAMYTPPGNCRTLLPLGFFRSQPWLALHWGIEGGGWWVYNEADLFGTGPHYDPSYGGVNWDGRSLVWSRRWEAMRDGVEDFNAVVMLKDLAMARNDTPALEAINDAVAYVASKCLTGMEREAADYDMDYATLMEHRQRIRLALERLVE